MLWYYTQGHQTREQWLLQLTMISTSSLLHKGNSALQFFLSHEHVILIWSIYIKWFRLPRKFFLFSFRKHFKVKMIWYVYFQFVIVNLSDACMIMGDLDLRKYYWRIMRTWLPCTRWIGCFMISIPSIDIDKHLYH